MLSVAFLLFLGLASLRTVGQLTGSQKVEGLGFMVGFSPLPNVFSDREGYEDFTTQIALTYSDTAGIQKKQILNNRLFKKISGPLYWRGLLGVSLGYAYRFPEALWLKSWKYVFCESQLIHKMIPSYEPKGGMRVSIAVEKNGSQVDFEKGIQCF